MRKLNYAKVASVIVADLKGYFEQSGFKKAVIGLSGGLDSAVVYALCVRALGADNVYGIAMPVGNSSHKSLEHAVLVSVKFGGELIRLDLGNAHRAIISVSDYLTMGQEEEENKQRHVRHGNVAARLRMIILFDFSAKLHALVMGTENLSEHNLGYFTLFGDAASCVEPIRNLYKTEVFGLARELGVPEEIINKPPTADLWQGQTDEGELGFTYKEADEFIDKLLKQPDVAQLRPPLSEIEQKVFKQVRKVSFKHTIPHVVPDILIEDCE
jgi:NAD+ synthase